MRVGLTAAIATAIAIGVVVATTGNGNGNGPPATIEIWVSSTGNDATCVRGNQSLPCLTFNKAYEIALLGDDVEVDGGTYIAQTIHQEASKDTTGLAADVVFQPASGESVLVAGVTLGTDCYDAASSCYTGPDHLTIKDMTDSRSPQGPWSAYHETNDATFENIDASNFNVTGVRDFNVIDGDWGPCSYGVNGCLNNKVEMDPNYRNERVLIEGGVYHDIRINTDGQHLECLFLVGGIDITVRRNKFYNCEFFDIFVQYYGDLNFLDGGLSRLTYAPHEGLVIENNWFAQSYDGDLPTPALWANNVWFDDGWGYGWDDVLVRYNSAYGGIINICGDGAGINPCSNNNRAPFMGGSGDHNVSFTNVRFLGNIHDNDGAGGACITGVTYLYNVFVDSSGTCGTGDESTGSYPYVNGVSSSAMDYHLTGGAGAIDHVTPLTSDYTIPDDYDDQTRPLGSARDAGADEKE